MINLHGKWCNHMIERNQQHLYAIYIYLYHDYCITVGKATNFYFILLCCQLSISHTLFHTLFYLILYFFFAFFHFIVHSYRKRWSVAIAVAVAIVVSECGCEKVKIVCDLYGGLMCHLVPKSLTVHTLYIT